MRFERWTLPRPAEPVWGFRTALLLVVLFTGMGVLTRLTCLDQNGTTAFWPANGALAVAMLLLRPGLSSLVTLICLSVNLALDLSTFGPYDSALYTVLNGAVAYVVAKGTRRFCGARSDLSRFNRLVSFGCIAFCASAVEAGLGEALALSSRPASLVLWDWVQWTMCDGSGFLLAAPATLLAIQASPPGCAAAAGRLERVLLLTAAALLTACAFQNAHSPAFVLIYPLLILIAFRAGPRWVFASILVSAFIAAGLTAHGLGPLALLANGDLYSSQNCVQPFLFTLFLTAVPANSALGENRRAARRLRQMKSVVEHCATHDVLTALVNRDLFRRRLAALLAANTRCAVILIDLDRFKNVNDTFGHAAGDELLRLFAARLLDMVGGSATVARFGGDEFAVLVPCAAYAMDPETLCARVAQLARAPFPLAHGTAYVSASIGLAVSFAGSQEAGELMRRADIALYAVKAAGRDDFRIFCDELDRAACNRAEIEADLRAALASGSQLTLFYQAKVDADGDVRGVEALLRWCHPRLGFVPPNQIVAVAEEAGLIGPLGDWILRTALRFARRWPHLQVAVNVSPLQLRQPDFVPNVLRDCAAAQLPYGRLELEITETALIEDIATVNGKLATLRAAGIKIALDDFGTGYSSLRHLHRCTVDRVKIDQSFVKGLEESGTEAVAIVKAIIELGHAMGLHVTAEGVETDTQRRFLVHAGIDEMQGYLFAKPLDEAGFAAACQLSPTASRYAVLQGGRS